MHDDLYPRKDSPFITHVDFTEHFLDPSRCALSVARVDVSRWVPWIQGTDAVFLLVPWSGALESLDTACEPNRRMYEQDLLVVTEMAGATSRPWGTWSSACTTSVPVKGLLLPAFGAMSSSQSKSESKPECGFIGRGWRMTRQYVANHRITATVIVLIGVACLPSPRRSPYLIIRL